MGYEKIRNPYQLAYQTIAVAQAAFCGWNMQAKILLLGVGIWQFVV